MDARGCDLKPGPVRLWHASTGACDIVLPDDVLSAEERRIITDKLLEGLI